MLSIPEISYHGQQSLQSTQNRRSGGALRSLTVRLKHHNHSNICKTSKLAKAFLLRRSRQELHYITTENEDVSVGRHSTCLTHQSKKGKRHKHLESIYFFHHLNDHWIETM